MLRWGQAVGLVASERNDGVDAEPGPRAESGPGPALSSVRRTIEDFAANPAGRNGSFGCAWASGPTVLLLTDYHRYELSVLPINGRNNPIRDAS